MRYETVPEFPGDWIGFAIEGRPSMNPYARSRMDKLALKPGWRDAPQNQLWLNCYKRESHSLLYVRDCSYSDFFLAQPHPPKGRDERDGQNGSPSLIIIGIHTDCGITLNDFASIAQKLGWQETESLAERYLEDLLDRVMVPYVAPCIGAEKILKSVQSKVWCP